mgnify:CR=1 FL=1
MKKFIASLVLCIVLGVGISYTHAAETNEVSAVTNIIPQVNLDLWIIPILPGGGTDAASIRTSTSSTNLIMDFTVPSKYRLHAAKVRAPNCDYTTGNEGYYVDVKEAVAGTMTSASLFSSPISVVDTGRNGVAVISDKNIADESLLLIYAYGTGTSPIINDMTLILYVERME